MDANSVLTAIACSQMKHQNGIFPFVRGTMDALWKKSNQQKFKEMAIPQSSFLLPKTHLRRESTLVILCRRPSTASELHGTIKTWYRDEIHSNAHQGLFFCTLRPLESHSKRTGPKFKFVQAYKMDAESKYNNLLASYSLQSRTSAKSLQQSLCLNRDIWKVGRIWKRAQKLCWSK